MSDAVIAALIAAVSSSGVTGLVLAVMQRRWKQRDEKDDTLTAIVNALKVLMVDRVRHLGGVYVANRGITLEDKENLKEMKQAYAELGGNGHLDVIMHEVDRLPIINKEG